MSIFSVMEEALTTRSMKISSPIYKYYASTQNNTSFSAIALELGKRQVCEAMLYLSAPRQTILSIGRIPIHSIVSFYYINLLSIIKIRFKKIR